MVKTRTVLLPTSTRIVLLSALAVAGCAPTPPPSEPDSSGTAPRAEGDAGTESQPASPQDGQTEEGPSDVDASTDESQAVVTRSGQELCEELCAKVRQSCKGDNVKFCLASCPDYQEASERCPLEVEEALSCQMKSEAFLLCSSVANEQCAPYYQAMDDCREGRTEPKKAHDSESSDLPSGWRMVVLGNLGGSYAMPKGDLKKDGAARYVQRDSHEFRVEPLSAVPDKYTDKTILRLGTAFVGDQCEKKLRLHGRYETGQIIHIRFSTLCETSSGMMPFEGIFHLSPGSGVAASVKPLAGTEPAPDDADVFYFGFEPSGG